MTGILLRLAVAVVRTWTRTYTRGMSPVARDRRRAEIESDLWEWQHDPDRGFGARGAGQILLRLLLGVPDDVFWRVAHVSDPRAAAFRAAATVLLFLVTWAYVQWLMPQPLPDPPARPMQFVSERPAIPPPPPPPPPANLR